MKLNGLDLNKLPTFCAVIEQGGYRGASDRIGLSRSAISQSITSLEAQLGKTLFTRSGIQLIPTEEAMRFYEEIRRYQIGLETAVDQLQKRATSESGLLRVGAYQEFARRKLVPAIDVFLSANPRTQIRFFFDSPSRLESLLDRGRIDLSFSIFPHRQKGIECREIYEEELCLVGRKDLASSKMTLTEIARLPVIDYYPTHLLFKRWWSVHSKKPPPRLNVRAFAATAEMVLEMVERGIGIGVVPKYLLKDTGASVRLIAPTENRLLDHMWLNRRKEDRANALGQAFIAEVDKVIG